MVLSNVLTYGSRLLQLVFCAIALGISVTGGHFWNGFSYDDLNGGSPGVVVYGAIAGVLAIMISICFRLFSNKEDESTARNLTAIIVDGICAVFFIVAGGSASAVYTHYKIYDKCNGPPWTLKPYSKTTPIRSVCLRYRNEFTADIAFMFMGFAVSLVLVVVSFNERRKRVNGAYMKV